MYVCMYVCVYIYIYDLIRTLNYGNYGIFLTMGNAGFTSPSLLLNFAVHQAYGETHATSYGSGLKSQTLTPSALSLLAYAGII